MVLLDCSSRNNSKTNINCKRHVIFTIIILYINDNLMMVNCKEVKESIDYFFDT